MREGTGDIQDSRRFEQLVRLHHASPFGFLARMGFEQADADELTQEAFLRAWRQRTRFDPTRASFATWLFTIAKNLALNELKRRSRQETVSIDLDALAAAGAMTDCLHAIDNRQRKKIIQNAIQQLRAKDRTLFALAYVDDLRADEAAGILGCSPGAYRKRLTRARRRLKNQLEGFHDELTR